MSYIDENGMTAFVQQDDLFEWGGFEMVRFYFEFWHNFVKQFSISKNGKKYRFFHKEWQKDMDLTKQQFDANYRIEKVEYK